MDPRLKKELAIMKNIEYINYAEPGDFSIDGMTEAEIEEQFDRADFMEEAQDTHRNAYEILM